MIKPTLRINKITHRPSFDPYLWHRRLGHVSETVVRKYLQEHHPKELAGQEWQSFFCEQCAISKALNQKAPGSNSLLLRDNPLDMLVTDVAGPFPMDLHGHQYMVTLRDHASTYIWNDTVATRDQVPNLIVSWVEHIHNTLGKYPKQIRCDNAPEYTSTLRKLIKPMGILLAPVAPYSPEQNGEAERVNRTLGDMARTMLHESRMPRMFWGYAYQTAGYIYNRIPNSKVKTCPLKMLYKIEPDPNSLYPFGAEALVQIPSERRTKLDERAQHARLIGYPAAGAGWLVYSLRERRIIHSTSVIFPEFQHLPVKKDVKKGDLDFILNSIALKLGEEETDLIAKNEQKILAEIEVGHD
jgi:hypothetical protein